MLQFDADIPSTDDGVWTSFEGSKLKIAHISNIKFQRLMAKGQQPFRKQFENGSMDPAKTKQILCKAMAGGVLVDWDKVVDSAKQPVPYSEERGETALMKNPALRDFVTEFSTNLANYRDEEVQELGKS
jgi:hypothetical protein